MIDPFFKNIRNALFKNYQRIGEREAEEVMDEWDKQVKNQARCPKCGNPVKSDEDGLCAYCV